MNPVWAFKTDRYCIMLRIYYVPQAIYDGDDLDGSIQARLDNGELVCFDSEVVVELDGIEIGSDYLCRSIYKVDDESAFWQDHRNPDPMNRNSSCMRKIRGENAVICHYFPGMVKEAIRMAREYVHHIKEKPYMRY